MHLRAGGTAASPTGLLGLVVKTRAGAPPWREGGGVASEPGGARSFAAVLAQQPIVCPLLAVFFLFRVSASARQWDCVERGCPV